MQDEKILPVEEMVAYEEFTDRVEILRELDLWVRNIQRMASMSTALIAPRRLGKTVLLDRLVNTVFFKPEYRVAPFYFKVKREETTLQDFLLVYATTFFRQYIAYCLQDPILYQNKQVRLKNLLECRSDHPAVLQAKDSIQAFWDRYASEGEEGARNHWDDFICIPEQLGSHSGVRVAVFIDEFQDMKFYIHDVKKESLNQVIERRRHDPGIEGTDLTATYDRQAQSRKAPMLVSGSAVTMIFRTVMGGPLGGRFGFKYLRTLSISDGAALLKTLLRLYAPDTGISTENALYAGSQVSGHPYYLYCLSVSEYENKKFDTAETIDAIIRYEIEQGKIFGFWQTHFHNNRTLINSDSEESVGKKIIYYFTRYNNRKVQIKKIAEDIRISPKSVEEKIEKLYLADMVVRKLDGYYAFNDICLMRFIQFAYQKDLEDVEPIDLSRQNLFNNLKGRFLELVIQVTMMKFNHEILEGKFFGKRGKIEVPLFRFVDTKQVKSSRSRSYQIDVFGQEKVGHDIWICECKYTRTKMGIQAVKKLGKAADALRKEAVESGLTEPKIRMWVVSTGGFTQKVLEYVEGRSDLYASDHAGINGIFRAYGGNYDIPVFGNS